MQQFLSHGFPPFDFLRGRMTFIPIHGFLSKTD
jgi:hypothetical protein